MIIINIYIFHLYKDYYLYNIKIFIQFYNRFKILKTTYTFVTCPLYVHYVHTT